VYSVNPDYRVELNIMNKDKAALDLLDEVTEIARSGDLQGTLLKVADIIADNVQLRADLERLTDAQVLLVVAKKAIPDFGGGTRAKEFRDGYARFNRGEQVKGLTSWQDGRETMRAERDALLQRVEELERDARRYQLLRDDPVTDRVISLMDDGLCGSMLDEAIDSLKPESLGARQEPGIMAE
jgi:hypothetical protein